MTCSCYCYDGVTNLSFVLVDIICTSQTHLKDIPSHASDVFGKLLCRTVPVSWEGEGTNHPDGLKRAS